jgi:hypothetical protein
MTDAKLIRDRIVQALEADLVGPFHPPDHDGPRDEVLLLPPSRWYLTGFLAPKGDRETHDVTSDDELGAGPDEDDEDADAQEPEPKQKKHYPASMGLSVLLPPASGGKESINVTVSFAEYVPEQREIEAGRRPKTVWRRFPRGPITVEVPLDPAALLKGVQVPDATSVSIAGKLEVAEAPGLGAGTRALAIFLVNERDAADDKGRYDAQFLFQAELELNYERGFVARPNRQGEHGADWDDNVSDVQFRDRQEWAVGHGVSVVIPEAQAGNVTRVKTTWVPRCEVRRVVTRDHGQVETAMEKLAALRNGAEARAALVPLVDAYGEWLDSQRKVSLDSAERGATREQLIENAETARKRILAGIELLERNQEAFDAFRLANEAMAQSALRRSPERYSDTKRPSWRLFQLAFLLLNLPGIADEAHDDRENVELIFFPTGGGKTEAYLGVIAFTLVLRRLRVRERADRGLGVAVLLRYTLRLLTLDQLARAATLVCALERIREKQPVLGDVRFSVGLWVGRTATANTLEQVKRLILEYKNSTSKTAPSPFPLVTCPWCNETLAPESLTLVPSASKAEAVVVGCTNFRCEFSARQNKDGLPVLFVDEQIYRELPAFLVATVDKFAMLPWRGETGMLFGRAAARQNHRFFGPMDPKPKSAEPLPDGLRPPELIVQDELHLISGPLGTMVGLYETAIEYLATRRDAGGHFRRPKVIASTATVRRAREHIRALFARRGMSLFPPPGVDESETWFARLDPDTSGRLYIGVAAQGRAMKGILLRAYVTLLTAAQNHYAASGGAKQSGDAYMTLVGYFNSLRELGGMRRLVEDEVRALCTKVEDRRPLDHRGSHPWLQNRNIRMEPVELTSRESTGKIKEAKDRLNKAHSEKEHVDVVLASNMISVGVDIDRLGLMVMAGQTKTTSEYIQASSRVGRQQPGLVVTCFNLARPRDRSHYERFAAYHQSFYRFVEATSLTPFSGPALERGLTGTLVAMTRLADLVMTPPGAAMDIGERRQLGELAVRVLAERGGRHDDMDADEVERLMEELRKRGNSLLDDWDGIVKRVAQEAAGRRFYSRFDRDNPPGKGLLFMAVDDDTPLPNTDEARFCAPTSMRDVEQSVHLWLERTTLGARR